jgi:hypothetical protein
MIFVFVCDGSLESAPKTIKLNSEIAEYRYVGYSLLLELFRYALYANLGDLLQDFGSLESAINQNKSKPEKEINRVIFQHFNPYNKDLGTVTFKKRQYRVSAESEAKISHGRICQVPILSKPTELGDLIFIVDHILHDERGRKIVSGTASIMQTKKESFIRKKGINLRQLHLMTYWPSFSYKNQNWEFDAIPDQFSFYLMVNDLTPAADNYCTNVFSSPLLTRLLDIDESDLTKKLKSGEDFMKPNTVSLLFREKIGGTGAREMPFLMKAFLIKALYPSLGSQSLKLRHFLKECFLDRLEEIEDCVSQTVAKSKVRDRYFVGTKNHKPPFDDVLKDDDEDLFVIRLKMIAKRIE